MPFESFGKLKGGFFYAAGLEFGEYFVCGNQSDKLIGFARG